MDSEAISASRKRPGSEDGSVSGLQVYSYHARLRRRAIGNDLPGAMYVSDRRADSIYDTWCAFLVIKSL